MFPPCIKILVRDSDISDNRHQHRHFPIKSLNIFSRPSTSLAAFFCAVCVDRPHAELRNGANIPINTSSAAAEGHRCCSPTAEDMHEQKASCSPPHGGGGELRGSRNRRRGNGNVFGARPAETACKRSGQLRASAGQRLRPAQFCELQSSVAPTSVYGFAAWRIFPHFGHMPMKNSAFMRGMGRPSTDRYSSLKRLLTVAFSVRSAHPNAISRSSDTLLI